MRHILLLAAFASLLLGPVAALGQTPPPRCGWWELWCGDSVYRNPNLSPTTKRKLYEHDPNVCHCDECRRMRLAAGVEYLGLTPVRRPPPPRTPVPPLYSAPTPYVRRVWCSSLSRITPATECPDK